MSQRSTLLVFFSATLKLNLFLVIVIINNQRAIESNNFYMAKIIYQIIRNLHYAPVSLSEEQANCVV